MLEPCTNPPSCCCCRPSHTTGRNATIGWGSCLYSPSGRHWYAHSSCETKSDWSSSPGEIQSRHRVGAAVGQAVEALRPRTLKRCSTQSAGGPAATAVPEGEGGKLGGSSDGKRGGAAAGTQVETVMGNSWRSWRCWSWTCTWRWMRHGWVEVLGQGIWQAQLPPQAPVQTAWVHKESVRAIQRR